MAQGNIPGDLCAAGTYDPISGTTLPGAHGLTLSITGGGEPFFPNRLRVDLAQAWATDANRLDVRVWLEQSGNGSPVIPLWLMFGPGVLFVSFYNLVSGALEPQPPAQVHVRVSRAVLG